MGGGRGTSQGLGRNVPKNTLFRGPPGATPFSRETPFSLCFPVGNPDPRTPPEPPKWGGGRGTSQGLGRNVPKNTLFRGPPRAPGRTPFSPETPLSAPKSTPFSGSHPRKTPPPDPPARGGETPTPLTVRKGGVEKCGGVTLRKMSWGSRVAAESFEPHEGYRGKSSIG
jgi:hypothetical protein